MTTTQSFSILFWINKSKEKNSKAPIYCRISINGRRTEISTKRSLEINKWNNALGLGKGNSEEIRILNSYLSIMKAELLKNYNLLISKNENVSGDKLKNLILGIKEDQKTLLEVFKFHNDKMSERVGVDVVKATHSKFVTVLHKVELFIKLKYKLKDNQIVDFEQ